MLYLHTHVLLKTDLSYCHNIKLIKYIFVSTLSFNNNNIINIQRSAIEKALV